MIIPEGWTYYAHRTNTEKWQEDPFDKDEIRITKIMSVVTESEVHQELMHYGPKAIQAFNLGNGEPFEIRCLICDLRHTRELENEEMKEIMLKEFYYDRRNIGGCYGQRHHSIPTDEELVVIGLGEYDEVFEQDKKIIWTIPKRFIGFYQEEIKKGKNRTIGLKSPNVRSELQEMLEPITPETTKHKEI